MHPRTIFSIQHFLLWSFLSLLFGCGGVHHYQIEKAQPTTIAKKLPGTVSLKVFAETIYHHTLGMHKYELYVKEAVEKQFQESLRESFEGGLLPEGAETNILVTALDTSTFPIADVINDVRLFFRVEIFDQKMNRLKTLTIYGFGCDAQGNVALGKAAVNSFYQLLPVLEELFIRQ